jgi:ATP-binding cassette subfamily F protein 3
MKFVERFRYKATKAKQAQSRLKMVERIEKVSAVRLSNPFNFEFKKSPEVGNPMLSLTKASVGYGETPLLSNISLSLYSGDRIALLGPNGSGKSTFIKALSGDLKIQGEAVFNKKLKIGYFAQHQLESLNLEEGAFWHLKNLDREVFEKEARSFLGSFNFIGDTIFEPVKNFSGGEKARLALALLVWQQPNILLLDEPSNHLDMEMREALASALQMYDGALILVTHDRYLLKSLANEFYLVADGTVKLFDGDLDDYQRWVEAQQPHTESKKKSKPVKKNSPQMKIADNDKLLAKLEKQLAEKEAQKFTLELKLGDPELYASNERAQELTTLTGELEKTSAEIHVLENEILDLL